MADADVLQLRMRHSRFDGANGGRPKKLLTQLLKLIQLTEDGSMEEVDAEHKRFLKEIALFEFNVQKIQIVADTAVREVDAGKKLRDELHKSMQKTEKDIAELKDRVAHERVLRQHKEEYALLAQKVTQYDSRSKTQSDNHAIQEDLKQLEEHILRLGSKMELRKKQMLLLLHLVEELKMNMDDEGDEAEAAEAAVGAGGGDVAMKDD